VLKKSITYTNPFTEQEVTEEHFFHISKADLVEMEVEENNASYTDAKGEKFTGMQAKLKRIVASNDGRAIMAEFKDILRRSYGKKEGDRFIKTQAVWEDFASSEAFSQLLWELCTQPDAAASFINGIVPSNLDKIAAEVREQSQTNTGETPALAKAENALGERPEDPTGLTSNPTPRVLTFADLEDMDADDLKSGLATGRYKLS
jgi:hypothetical protein